MSNQEFENYITLMGKLLQLNPDQRDQIAGELQDHMQMRVAELESEGVEKQQAIKQALEEFGDVAGMAKNFQTVIKHRNRRRMMRFVTFSIAGSFVAAVLLMAMWPLESHFGAPSQSVAQEGEAQSTDQEPELAVKPPVRFSTGTERTIKAEQALRQNVDLDYDETPYAEVQEDLQARTGLNFILSSSAQDDWLTSDKPITVNLKDVPLNKALDLMLETNNATYVIDDGIIIVISRDDALDPRWLRTKMYDCRDLVAVLPKTAKPMGGGIGFGGGGGGGGFGGGNAQGDDVLGDIFSGDIGGLLGPGDGLPNRGGGAGGVFSIPPIGNLGDLQEEEEEEQNVSALIDRKLGTILALMKAEAERKRPEPSSEQTLVGLVQSTIGPDDWSDTGYGNGTIDAVNGILVVSQSEQTHQKIDKFLADLEASVLRRTRVGSHTTTTSGAVGETTSPAAVSLSAANVEVETLTNACLTYKLRVGSFPKNLQDLNAPPSGIDQASWGGPYLQAPIENDPWNRPYKHSWIDGNNEISIQSAGPDGKFGNDDDVSNTSVPAFSGF